MIVLTALRCFSRGISNLTETTVADAVGVDPRLFRTTRTSSGRRTFNHGRVVVEWLSSRPLTDTAPVCEIPYQIGDLVLTTRIRPVHTYKGQATTKYGLEPQTHAVIYTRGAEPKLIEGEEELEKKPIEVVPFSDNIELEEASRINFASPHTVHYNQPIQPLGRVATNSKDNLRAYYAETLVPESDSDVDSPSASLVLPTYSAPM